MRATGGRGGRGGANEPAATGGSVRPEEVRREVKRLEDERLRLAPEVTGGDPAAVAEDQRLEKCIRELASTERETEREARSDELRAAWRRNHPGERPGEKGGGRGRSG